MYFYQMSKNGFSKLAAEKVYIVKYYNNKNHSVFVVVCIHGLEKIMVHALTTVLKMARIIILLVLHRECLFMMLRKK